MVLSDIVISPIKIQHAHSFRQCLDTVAREGKYLASDQAPSLKSVQEFVTTNVTNHHAQFVALHSETVIGWCDVLPMSKKFLAHCGVLGMGVHPDYRRQGLGWRLLDETVKQARSNGLKRVELEVLASNTGAILLYAKYGFLVEGIKKNAFYDHNRYTDLMVMGLWLD